MIRLFQLCNFVVFQVKQFLYFISIYYVSSAPTLHGESFHGSLEYINFVNLEPVLLTQKSTKIVLQLNLESWMKPYSRIISFEFKDNLKSVSCCYWMHMIWSRLTKMFFLLQFVLIAFIFA